MIHANNERGERSDSASYRKLAELQREDGTWRFCFDNGTITDAYMIVVLRTSELPYEKLIRQLHDRIVSKQQPDGTWKVYADEEEGNLAATVDAYYALLYSGYSSAADERMQQAARFIQAQGGVKGDPANGAARARLPRRLKPRAVVDAKLRRRLARLRERRQRSVRAASE